MGENDTISFDVNLTIEDVYSFQKSYLKKRFPLVKLITINAFFLILAIILFIQSIDSGRVPSVGIFIILLQGALIIFIPLSLKKQAKASFNSNKLIQKTQHYEFDEEGIRITSESAVVNIKWEELYKALETKESLQFFISKQQSYVVPKRCIDIEQINLLRNYIKNVSIPKEEIKRWYSIFGKKYFFYILLFLVILIALFCFKEK